MKSNLKRTFLWLALSIFTFLFIAPLQAQVVRDHRTKKTDDKVRDHRTETNTTVRDHRENKKTSQMNKEKDDLSEYEKLETKLSSVLEKHGIRIAELTEDEEHRDISFLSSESGASAENISLLQTSFKLSEKCNSSIPPEIFFGLIYMQYPSSFNELRLVSNDSLIKGINDAIKMNIISSKWLDQIPDLIEDFNLIVGFSKINKEKDMPKKEAVIKRK